LDPGKTHKWKTSERGTFYYSELREIMFFYNSEIISISHKLISRMCPTIFLENSAKLY
jgi:hypothetical protein